MTYKLKVGGAIRLDDGQNISPATPAWQEFLNWVAAGGKPLPADGGISMDDMDSLGWNMATLPWSLSDPVWSPAT